jgi:DNA-binding MarR family transcriptional regulator
MDSLQADLDALENAMRLFFQTMKRPQRWNIISAEAGVALDRPAAVILHILVAAGGSCRVQDVALQLGIEAPSVTRKTQELERLGYLRRVASTNDRRAVNLQITAVGETASKRLHAAQRKTISQVIANWPAAERQQFAQLFERFSNDLQNIDN